MIDHDKQAMTEFGTKLDTGKVRFDLLPPDALHAVAQVYTFGAEKYADRNWEKGMDWGRVYAAGQRHMNSFWGGEARDPETGYLHTAHAAFASLTLTSYQLRDVGADSRFIIPVPPVSELEPKEQILYVETGDTVRITKADFAQLLAASNSVGKRA